MKPKRKVLCGLAMFGAVLLLLMAALCWDLRSKAAATLARHEAEAAAKLAEVRGRVWKGAVLGGEAIPGNRWADFAAALDAIEAIPEAEINQIPALRMEVDYRSDPAALDAIFARHAGVVEQLRRSFRSRDLIPPYSYEQGFAMELPYISRALRMSRYLAGAGTRCHERGKDAESVEHGMLAIATGHTSGLAGPSVNFLVMLVCEQVGVEHLRFVLGEHGLSAAELEALGVALDRFECFRPTLAEAFEIEALTSRLGLLQMTRSPDSRVMGPLPRSGWFLFSTDLLLANALNESDRFYRAAMEQARLPARERFSTPSRLDSMIAGTRNPLSGLLLPAMARMFTPAAAANLRWRLLRISVALARYEAERGAFPPRLQDLVPTYLPKLVDCPYSGQPFGYAAGRVWSIGGDGKDDGGRPVADETNLDADGDVVWTVKRK